MMSILLVAAVDQQPQELPPAAAFVLVAWTLVSLAVFWKARVFSADALRHGEPRLAPHESLGNFAVILLAGLCTWILIPAMYSAATRRAPAIGPATAPFAIDAAELIALSAIASSAAMLVLLAGNALFRDDGLARLGLRLRQAVPAIPIGMAGIILIMPLITWVGMLTIKLWELLGLEHDTKHEMLRILERTDHRGLARLLIFTAAVIAPLYEEVLFRGHLQTLLAHLLARVRRGPEPAAGAAIPPPLNAPYEPPAASALPYAAPEVAPRQPIPLPSAKWMAIIMTSIAFAIVHPWWTTPPIFFLSVCLGYAYERWKNLWIPIVMHALFNALSMMVSQYVPQ